MGLVQKLGHQKIWKFLKNKLLMEIKWRVKSKNSTD